MADFETGGTHNLDPTDFGEPMPETRARFAHVLDSLKNLAVGKTTYEIEHVVGDIDVESTYGISRDDLCPITQYHYDQIADPLFGPNDEVYLTFQLTDGDPEKFNNWYRVLGLAPLNSIHYEGVGKDIIYDSSFDCEMVYVTEPRDSSVSVFSDEFLPMMQERVKNHMQAMKVGASNPTEGSMKQLIQVLEQEIAKRIVSD